MRSDDRIEGAPYNYIHFEGQNKVHPSENMREFSSYEVQQLGRRCSGPRQCQCVPRTPARPPPGDARLRAARKVANRNGIEVASSTCSARSRFARQAPSATPRALMVAAVSTANATVPAPLPPRE